MHTEVTLLALTAITTMFGLQMRRFKTQTCDHVETFELDREVAARARRLARENPACPTPAGGKKPKKFNLLTYKFHALGDYVSSIRWFGTSDSYSTQTVRTLECIYLVFLWTYLLAQSELNHRTSKANYLRTSKNNPAKQLASIERRQSNLDKIMHARESVACNSSGHRTQRPENLQSEQITDFDPGNRYHIARSQKNPLVVGSWLRENDEDPALQVMSMARTCPS